MALPQYTAQSNIATGSTGPTANASELNPFTEETASKLQQGINSAEHQAEVYDEKLDTVWAYNQAMQLQGTWRENVQGYTDPDSFQKDYAESQQSIMNQAPSGRASDTFVREMGQFGNHLTSRVINQKVASDRMAATQQLKDANLRLQVDATEAGNDVKAQRAASKKIAKVATGIVPKDIIDSMQADMNTVLDKTEIQNVANQQGAATAADKLTEGKLGQNLTPHENAALLNSYQLQGQVDLETAKVNGKKFFDDRLRLMKSGQLLGTSPEKDQAMARVMASSTMDKKGENFNAKVAEYSQSISDAKNEGVMRTKMLGMSNTESDDFLRNVQVEKGLGSKEFETVKKIQTEFDSQKQKDPFQFIFNSPVFTQKYTNALNMLDQAKESKDPDLLQQAQMNFKSTLDSALAMQGKAGIPQNEQTVMTVPEASQYAARIMQGGVKDVDKTFSEMKDRYGEYFPQAFAQLQSSNLPVGKRVPAHFAALEAHSDNPAVHQALISAMQAENPAEGKAASLDNQIKGRGLKPDQFVSDTAKALQPYTDALNVSPTGVRYSSEMTQAVTSYAKQLYVSNPNLSTTEAANKAAEAVIFSQYDTHAINGKTFLLPRADSSGHPYGEVDLNRIKSNLDYEHFLIGTGRRDLNIDMSKIYGNIPQSPELQATFQRDLYKNGQWVLAPDKQNLQMVLNVANSKVLNELGNAYEINAPGKGIKYLYDRTGKPVQISVSSLNQDRSAWFLNTNLANRERQSFLQQADAWKHIGTGAKAVGNTALSALETTGKIMLKGAEVMGSNIVPPVL